MYIKQNCIVKMYTKHKCLVTIRVTNINRKCLVNKNRLEASEEIHFSMIKILAFILQNASIFHALIH